MKQQHPIDELFRSKLENHAVEPPMHLWENIDENRDREKILLLRSSSRKYWILASLLLIFGLSLWTFTPSLKTNIAQSKVLVPSAHTSSLNDSKNKLNNTNSNHTSSKKTNTTKAEASTKNKSQGTDNQQNKIKKSKTYTTKKEGLISSKKGETILPVHTINISAPTNSNVKKNTKFVLENNKNKKQKSNNAAHIGLISKTKKVISPIPKNALELLSFEKGGSLNLLYKETDCPTFNGLPKGLYLDVNASIDVAQRTMKSRSTAESDDYLNSRKKTESPYIAFSTGVHLTALSNRGLAVKTGFDYTQINEVFNYENGHWVDTTFQKIWDNNGTLIGYDTIVETGTRTIKVVNRYRMLDIPLLLGYELNFSNFSLNAYGGPIFNIAFAKKGAFLSPDDTEPVGSVDGGEPAAFSNAFRSKLGMGWYTSIGFAYKLRKGTQLRFEPYFRIYPKSFTKMDFPIEQKYFLTGIKIGLRQRLGRVKKK